MKDEIIKSINESKELIARLEDLLINIGVDIEYIESDIDVEDIKDALLNAVNAQDWDINNKSDISYKDDIEKRQIFYNGIKSGKSDAIFWMADSFGLVDFFENEINPIFHKSSTGVS